MKIAAAAFVALGALALVRSFGTAATTPSPRPAATPAKPCGFVEFLPVGRPRYESGTVSETIRATVTYPDTHRDSAVFPYPWVYPNGEQTDPWSATNLARGDFAVTLQRPPPGTDLSKLPPLIAYVLEHSDARGYTDLEPCPHTWTTAAPAASAQPSPTQTPTPPPR